MALAGPVSALIGLRTAFLLAGLLPVLSVAREEERTAAPSWHVGIR